MRLMMRAAAAVVLVCLSSVPARAENTNDVLIALQIGSEAVNAAALRGGEEIARQRTLLLRRERETRLALRRAGSAEKEARRLRADLAELQRQIKDLIETLSEGDQTFATAIRSYSEGLTGLLSKGDPRITAVIERYAAGDDAALGELPELTRLTVNANRVAAAAVQDAMAKRDAELWRDTARVMTDGLLRDRVTTATVLAAWREAAALDPGEFDQWLQIARLEANLGNDGGVKTALSSASSTASTDLQRASVLGLYLRPEYGTPPGLAPGADPIEAALDLYSKILVDHPNNAWLQGEVLSAIDALASRQLLERTSTWSGGQPPSPEILAPTRKLVEGGTDIAEALLKRYPENEYILGLASRHFRSAGEVALSQRRYDDAATFYERVVELSRNPSSRNPGKNGRRDEMAALKDLAMLKGLNGDSAGARAALSEAARISEQIWQADLANVFKRHDVWSAHTGLGFFDQSEGDFASSRADFERALLVGEADKLLPRTNYMVALTLPRLARVQAVLGDFTGAERSYRANAALRDAQMDKSDISVLDPLNDEIGLADIAFKARQYPIALERVTALQNRMSDAVPTAELKQADIEQYRLICFLMLTDILIEMGDIQAAITQYERTLSALRERRSAEPVNQEMALVAAGIEVFLQDLKGTNDGWPAIIAALDGSAKQGSVTNVRADYVQSALAFARARAQMPAVVGDLPVRRVASLKASLATARRLDATDLGDGYFASLAAYYMMTLARLPDSGIGWADVAAHFRVMVTRHLIGIHDDRRASMGLAFLRERQKAKPRSEK